MLLKKKMWENIILTLVVIMAGVLIYSPVGQCQNWAALPPYNTLWPLWSPALSPVSAATGLPAPLVTSLTRTTVLPVQPGLTWNPALANPWLLYNTPLGMAYYDPVLGVGLWPPAGLFDTATSTPIPLTLPAGYSALAPTDPAWLLNTVPLANQFYTFGYPLLSTIGTLPVSPGFTIPTGVTFPLPPIPTGITFPAIPTGVTLPPGVTLPVPPTLLNASAII